MQKSAHLRALQLKVRQRHELGTAGHAQETAQSKEKPRCFHLQVSAILLELGALIAVVASAQLEAAYGALT